MIVGNLTGNAKLPIKETLSEIADWAAEQPLDNDVVFCMETKSFFYYNEAGGGAIDIGTPYPVRKVDLFTLPGDTGILPQPDLVNRTILGFEVNGIGRYCLIGTPSAGQVRYGYSDGTFSLPTGETFGTDWVRVIYSIEPTAV